MSWSEIKKKKEEEEKKKKSSNTSDSTLKQISNTLTGSLWKDIGQNIITSQRNAEIRKQKEQEFKKKLNINQNIPISPKTSSNTKREIKPSVTQSYANNYKNATNNSTWNQIKNIANNKNIMTLANKEEMKNATELTSADIDAMTEANSFNNTMKNGTTQEKVNAIIGHFGNSIIGGAKQTVGGVGNVGTTLGARVVKSVRNMAKFSKNEELAEKLDSAYDKIVDKGREINDRATYFNKVNSRIDNNAVKTVTGATNTVANVATNAFLTAGTGGGTVLQGLQVGGSSAQEVLNENKDNIGKATTTGIAKGITSYLTEKMFDANILTKGAKKSSIQKLVNDTIENKIKSQLGRNIADKATGIIGENLEEIVEDNVGNLIDRIVNNKKLPEWKEWLNNTSDTIKATTLSTTILNLVGLGGDNNQDIEADLRKQNASEQDIQKAKEFVQAVTQENIQLQNTDNKDINQGNKMPQNGFSQEEKTETLRQEARNKLESIKQNYDENSYNQMQEFIETAPSEKALNQVISDLNKEAETKQVAPLKQKQEVQLPMQQTTQNKSFEDVAFEAMNNYESNEVESPLKNRDMDSIGKQTKVNAYQYDNPKVKPYFQEMAQQMGEDLAYISSSDNRSTQKGGGTKLSATTKAMDILHNEQGYSYNQIAQGLQNIIDDKGSENNAISKKIELVIDEQLRNGYNNAFGKYVEPNQEYINTIQGNKDVQLPMKQEKPNIINKKVNEYIDSVKDNFKSDINIKTQSINEGDVAPLDYNKAGQSVLAKKAQNLVDRLKTRVFKNNNEDIHVSNTDIKKSISETLRNKEQSKYKKENIAVFSQLDKVIENGKEISSDIKDNKNRDYYSGYKYYVSNVNIDGTPYVVEFDTRLQDSGDGSMERHFRLERVYPVNKNEVVSNTAPKETSDNTFLNETTSINNSISQNEQNVKSDNTNINNMQNNQENMQQFSMSEQQKQNNFEYKESKNSKVDTFRKDASKYWDNSEKTNKLVNTIEKVINDKGYNIRLDDTLGDNVNGRIVTNNQTGEIEITLNPNSSRTGEFILGHELTHAIQTQEMIDLVNDRMTKDGDLRNAVEDLKKLYNTDEINAEVLADISGQLFGNQEFINNLSIEKPSVFKRIYDKIISLANKITGNSNEALFIKDLKNKWEKAYRENTNKITNAEYSLNKDGAMKDNKTGKKVILQAESMNDGKNLLAIHNLDESKLKGVLELGGFPVPSIAITNPDIVNHSQFGDISVIFNKNTINPEIDSRNEVYDRDVWSPTFPRVDYDISSSTIKDYITKGLQYDYKDDIISSAVTNYMYDSNLLDRIDRNGFEETLKDLKNSKELKYFYKNVVEKGEYSPKTKPLQYNKNYSNETLQRFIDLFDEDMDLADFYYHYMNYQDMQMSDEQRQKLKDNIKKAIEPEIENEIKEDLEKKPNLTKEEQEKYRKALYEIETDWIENRPYELREFVANASQYSKNGEAQTIDREATLNDISNYVNQEQFENWVDDSFGKMFKDAKKGIRNNKEPYTPSGNLRSFNQLHEDYNLQNVVNYMIAQDTKGGEGGFMSGGFGEIQAKQGNKFNSISDIKANEDRLVISEEASKQLEPLKDNIHDDIEKLSSYYKVSSSYYNNSWENSANAISEFSGKSKLTEANLKKVLDSYYNFDIENIPKEVYSKIIKDLNNLKNITTDYFEAKPQRAVGFDEIDAIVIPKDVSKEVKQQLKDRGIKTIEYDRNNENERADILKSLNEYKFSKTSKSWQDYLEKNYKSKGTTTDLRDIRLSMKEKQEVKAPLKQGNVQQNQNNNTPGENINWNEIERPENNQKFRKHYRSIIESSNTTAEAKAVAKELMGTDTYTPETNKGQLAQADQRIMTSSPEVELQSLLSRAMNGEKISSVDIAVGERLIQYFSKTGNKQQLQDAIQATAMAGTSAGQTVQALSMLNHQTPQGQATWIQRSVDKMNKELAKKKGGTITTDADGNLQVINKQGVDITDKVDLFNLTPEMIDKIMNSENQEQMYKNIDEVYGELGQQVPLGTLEKIDSWRYFSMLANARTHIRNMVGNLAMGKTQRIKDKLAGGIEDVVSKFNPKMERTKTLAFADKKTKDFVKQDFKNMEVQSRLELNENKYNPQSRLQNARRIFKSNAMENTLGRLFNLNDKLLSAEDGIGLKAGYQKALADYITANKIDVDNITDAQLNKARNYAVQQAKEATFHQANALANLVNQLGTKNKVGKFIVDATLPFKKTPMNVAKSGIEYSPVGLLKSAIFDTVNLRKGNISINQYIDNVSKGLTGSGVALVGYALAKAGILKASGSDDKDKEKYDEEQGKQSYSIEIAGKTYSLDWLSPTGIPLFIGAEINNLENQQGNEKNSEKKTTEDWKDIVGRSIANITNAGATAINPMSEMSMISGITSVLSSYNKDNALGDMATNMGKSYINQFVPTVLGQVAKTTDDYERTTKSTKTGTFEKALDQTVNQIKNKIPGLRQTLPIKTDIWGNDVKQEVNLPLRAVNNFINPATVKNVSTDKVDMELNKLYEENHSSSLLPDILTKTVQLNKQTYRLSNKEYAEFTKNYGQTSHKLIENFIKTSDYNKLTQEQKETAISNIYSYAKEQNKMDYAKKVNETVKPSTLYTTMKEIEKNGGKQSEYLSYLAKTKGMSKESEKNKVLADSNYSNRTKEIIYTNGTGKDDNLYNNLLSKSHINMTEYLDYKDKVSNKVFSADKDKNGKTVTGSAKAKVINYLNNNITGVGNRLLIAGKSYALQNNEKQKLAQYINSIVNTREERIEIYKQLDKNFYVRNGKVYMRVSK